MSCLQNNVVSHYRNFVELEKLAFIEYNFTKRQNHTNIQK